MPHFVAMCSAASPIGQFSNGHHRPSWTSESTAFWSPYFQPVRAPEEQVRRPAHALHAAGRDQFGVAGPDRLGGEHDRLQPGAAHLVDRERRDRVRQPGQEGRLPGRVLPEAGLQDVAEDDFVDLLRRRLGPLQRRLERDRPRAAAAGTSASPPRNLPIGVRAAERMKASAMGHLALLGDGEDGRPYHQLWYAAADVRKQRRSCRHPRRCSCTERLTKDYGRFRALDALNLDIGPGEVFGLLGPNGSGKSTALRLLLGFLRPTAGRATIAGHDCWRDSVAARRHVAYLPGELRLYENMTGRQLVRFLARLRGQPIDGELDALAQRFDIDLARPLAQLSSGMKRKVALLTVLVPAGAAPHPRRADQHPRPDHARRTARPSPRGPRPRARRCCSRRTSSPRSSRSATASASCSAASSSTCRRWPN